MKTTITIFSISSEDKLGREIETFGTREAMITRMGEIIDASTTDDLEKPLDEMTPDEIEELFLDPDLWCDMFDTYTSSEEDLEVDVEVPALTGANLDAILAGLRLLQRELDNGDLPRGILDIYTNCGEHPGLDVDLVGDLCEEINQ